MKHTYKKCTVFLTLALALVSGELTAQSYPNKTIKFIVGYSAGSSTDILARTVSTKLAERIGQPVVVENKPGADSMVAYKYMTTAAPDGHTLLVGGSSLVLNPGLYESVPYDPIKDFIPITEFASYLLVFTVNPTVPATSIQELIALAKSRPGELNYGAAAPPHYVAAELFKKQAGVRIVHVPYKGGAPALTAGIAGQVQMVVLTIAPQVLVQVRAGKLRALAVTGVERSRFLPEVPNASESGLDFEGGMAMWLGLLAPAGTPSAIIDKLYSELSVVLKSKSEIEHLASLGFETSRTGNSPAEFGAIYRADFAKWTKLTKDLNIRAK